MDVKQKKNAESVCESYRGYMYGGAVKRVKCVLYVMEEWKNVMYKSRCAPEFSVEPLSVLLLQMYEITKVIQIYLTSSLKKKKIEIL